MVPLNCHNQKHLQLIDFILLKKCLNDRHIYIYIYIYIYILLNTAH